MLPTDPLILKLADGSLLWILYVAGLCIWLLRKPRAKEPLKMLLLGGVLSLAGPVSTLFLTTAGDHFPLKYDYLLYAVDQSLGLSAFWVARQFSEWQRGVLYVVYESLPFAMIFWYGRNLTTKDGRPRQVLIAYVAAFLIGPLLYLVVPGCGPRYAFGAQFPLGHPTAPLTLVNIENWPNAIPSLHLASALLFVLYAGAGRWSRIFAWGYLAATVAATLTFEHYVIDLIVGVPFACFVERLAAGAVRQAAVFLGVVLLWLLAIRGGTPTLVLHPLALRLLATATILCYPVCVRWRDGSHVIMKPTEYAGSTRV